MTGNIALFEIASLILSIAVIEDRGKRLSFTWPYEDA